MKLLLWVTSVAAALLAVPAMAAGSWVKTSSGPDSSFDGTSLHTEYVVPSSIKGIRGNYRTAFVKTTFSPAVAGFGNDSIATVISQSMVDCNTLSWGIAIDMGFDAEMKPITATSNDYDRAKPVWVLKDMKQLSPSDITYRTARYICEAKL